MDEGANKLNVLYLTNNGDRASTTVATRGWIDALASRGLRPTIASPLLGELAEWAKAKCGATSYQVNITAPSKTRPLPFLMTVRRLRSICRKHRIDLIHCNEQDCCPLGSYLARWAGIPLAVTVHFSMARPFCEWAFGGRRAPNRMFFVSRRTLKQCSSSLAGIVSADRLHVLHNGLDLARYQPDAALRQAFRCKHHVGEDLAIGVACALRPRKQLEHLFKAFGRLKSPGVRVFVAGFAVPGDEQYADQLIKGAQQQLGDKFTFLGELTDLRPMTNGLDLFINTSKEESFGMAVLEAVATGCPVVGYDSKAVDEVVLPDGGEITPQDDIPVLAEIIDRWLSDRRRLQAARARAAAQAQRFDIRKLSEQLWDEYREMLRERAGVVPQTGLAAC